MPARTNDYQQLVALIEKVLAPKGAKITESAMVPARGIKGGREVDILIEGEYGPYKIKIAAEVKDTGRKMSLPTFESFIGKYRGDCRILVDQLIVISSSGFSKNVLAVARQARVELLTVADVTEEKLTSLGPKRLAFRIAPFITRVTVEPPLANSGKDFDIRSGKLVCQHGNSVGVAEWAQRMIFYDWLPNHGNELRAIERQMSENEKTFAIVSLACHLERLNLQHSSGVHKFDSLIVHVGVTYDEAEATHTTYERRSSTGTTEFVRNIKAVMAGKRFSLSYPIGKQRPEKVVLRIDDAEKPKPKAARKTRSRKRNEA